MYTHAILPGMSNPRAATSVAIYAHIYVAGIIIDASNVYRMRDHKKIANIQYTLHKQYTHSM